MNIFARHIVRPFGYFPALAVLLLLVFAAPATAQVSVTLEANPTRVQLEDVLRLTVRISGARSIDRNDVSIAGTDNFEMGTPSVGSQTSFTNGKFSQSVELTYRIRPLKQGTFKLGPATVRVGKQTYTSRSVMVTVDPMEEIRGKDQDTLFMTAEVFPRESYPGQELTCRIRLYWTVPASNIGFEGFPTLPGLEFTQQAPSRSFQKTINGKNYEVGELLFNVTPSEIGEYDIPPLSIMVEVLKKDRPASQYPRNMRDDRFFGRGRRVKTRVYSEPLSFSVKPFPTDGQPANFNGLLGQYSAQAVMEPGQIKAGESGTLTLTLMGRGTVQLMPDVELPRLPGVKVYPDKPNFQDGRADQGPFGKKTMKWALVPQVEGTVTIPEFTVPFFNPKTAKYEIARTQALELEVLPGEVTVPATTLTEMPITTPAKHRVEMLGEDILKIHESPQTLSPGMGQTMPKWLAILILVIPLLPLAGSMALRRLARVTSGQVKATQSKKAYGVFVKAVKDLGQDQAGEAFKALQEYFAAKLGLDGATLTSLEAEKTLLGLGVNPDVVTRLTTLFSRLESCVFSQCSQEFSPETCQELLETVKIVDKKVKV